MRESPVRDFPVRECPVAAQAWEFPLAALETSLYSRFESIAAKFPDNPAVSDGINAWSYRELDAMANGIAASLLSPEVEDCERQEEPRPVVLLLETGALMVAAILGVLKAGRFYIPLDPLLPFEWLNERLKTILAESPGARLLYDEASSAAARGAAGESNRLLLLTPAVLNAEIRAISVEADAPCYCLYTSGSTGTAKPILQTHRNVLADIRRLATDFAVVPVDRFALLYYPWFSASVGPIFGALLSGASVHIYPSLKERLGGLAEWLRRERITICDINLMAYREITRSVDAPGSFPAMRAVGLGGERVDREDFERFRRCFAPGCILQNGYGTTETRTVSQFLLTHDTEFEGSVVPVGWPVEGKEVLLHCPEGGVEVGAECCEARREVADGQEGEIVVRSRYLSPGYWKRPDLTGRSFEESKDGSRLYKTGDIGMRLPDGCLVHLGRRDDQIKVRGHRVELSQVEAAFDGLEHVREVAVVPDLALNGESRLVAYIVFGDGAGQAPSLEQIRSHLALHLPSYMLPGRIFAVKAMPRLGNGKLDLVRLRGLAAEPMKPSQEFVCPRDSLEAAISRIAEEVLEVSGLGIHGNFFDLGCNSLQAVNFLARLERDAGRAVPPEVFFRDPTVSGVAEAIRDKVFDSPGACVIPINSAGSRDPIFCFPGVGLYVANWFHLSRHLGGEQLLYTLQPRGFDGRLAPHRTVEEMAEYFAAAIQQVDAERPVTLLGYSVGGILAQDCGRQLLQLGRDVKQLILIDALDLGRHRPVLQFAQRVNRRLGRALRERRVPGFGRNPEWYSPPKDVSAAKVAVIDAFREAIKAHRPGRFGGPAIYIQPSQSGLWPQQAWKNWRRLVTGPIEFKVVTGDHFTMTFAHNAEELARVISPHL